MENVSATNVLPKERPLTAAFEAMKSRMPVSREGADAEELRRQSEKGGFQGFGSPPGKF